MKKNISIVIGLAFLCLILYSCEQEDQINSFKSDEHSIEVDKNSSLPLQTRSITKEEIEEENCNDPDVRTIKAGQHTEVGNIFISNSETKLFVTYDLTGTDWWLSETHLFAGDLNEAPFTKSGNPQMGQFPYHGQHDLTQEYTFCISIENTDDPVSIIAHAVVVQKQDGQTIANETAFGEGETKFSGNRWGWIIEYQPADCEDESNNDDDNEEGTNDDDTDNEEDGNSEDSSSEDESTANGDNGTNNGQEDSGNTYGCMDAFVYNNEEQSSCMLPDFGQWGWTNLVYQNSEHWVPGGVNYTYPLYASAFQCDTSNSMLVGEMKLNIQGGDGKLYASVEITLTNPDLSITDVNLYFGNTKYPLDDTGKETISFEKFDFSLTDLNQDNFSASWIEWDPESYFIAHVGVCPKNTLP